jgi:hypothetical protein
MMKWKKAMILNLIKTEVRNNRKPKGDHGDGSYGFSGREENYDQSNKIRIIHVKRALIIDLVNSMYSHLFIQILRDFSLASLYWDSIRISDYSCLLGEETTQLEYAYNWFNP